MHKHAAARTLQFFEDWEARAKISEALEQLVDEAAREAEDLDSAYAGRHSSGTIDYGAELEALTEWFGIE